MEHGRFNHKHLGRFLESFSIKWLMIVVAIYVGMDYARAMPQNIDKLIEIYETKGCRVDDANKIFDFLNKEEITDSKIVFAENTPKILCGNNYGIGWLNGTMMCRIIPRLRSMP